MVFKRWVTPGQADADLLRLARLTTAAAENREFDLPKTKPAASGRAVDGIEERDGVADAPRPRVRRFETRQISSARSRTEMARANSPWRRWRKPMFEKALALRSQIRRAGWFIHENASGVKAVLSGSPPAAASVNHPFAHVHA